MVDGIVGCRMNNVPDCTRESQSRGRQIAAVICPQRICLASFLRHLVARLDEPALRC